ncbi:hypothetical protein GE300_05340 [Rhodobacteraceae bacterium 2CG4]|uniref:PRC-barrel domain-containing protein n=1 Tax=Halovulum marinum TaxID=2662447 RepID=A0A6L5YYR7_9RHOB|nr:PRC-barrel domain-containing protein [Halovulum marinum]MSU89050.1 hypothetical protein [Halovulum marinum]
MRMTKTFASITAMALMAGTAFAQDTTTETEVEAETQVQAGDTSAEGGTTLTTEGSAEGETLQAEGDSETAVEAESETMQAEGETELETETETMQAETETELEAETEGMLDVADINTEELTGKPVYSSDDERVGEIGELILDANGQVTEVIIDVGGFLGLGEKPVAVAFEDLRFETEAEADTAMDTGAAVGTEGAPTAVTDTAAGGDAALEAEAEIEYRIYVPMTEEELENMPEYEG